MKMVLPGLVDDYQFAFVPQRHMSDNVLRSQDLLHIINKKKAGDTSFVAVKIDLNKAYD